MPFPAAPDAAEGAHGRAQKTETGRESPGSNGTRAGETAEANVTRHPTPPPRTSKRSRARTVEEAVVADERRQMEMDFAVQTGLALDNPGDQDLSEIEIALDNLDALAASIVGNEVDLVSEEAGSDVCDESTQPLSVDDRVTLKE